MFGFQLDDADFFAFLFIGAQNFFREVGAHRVLRDDLRGHAKNIRRGAVIFHERDAEWSRVSPFAPAGETLQKKFKAAERGAAEAIDGLVVVAYCDDVFSFTGEEFEQAKLRDIGVLKFVDEDVSIFFSERARELRRWFREVRRLR